MNPQSTPNRSRFRSRTLAGLTALLLPLAAVVGLAAPAEAATSATATFSKPSDWGSGFEGKWTVKNTGTTALTSWTVEWDFPSGTTVTSAWDAVVTSSGNHWSAKDEGWNGSLAPVLSFAGERPFACPGLSSATPWASSAGAAW